MAPSGGRSRRVAERRRRPRAAPDLPAQVLEPSLHLSRRSAPPAPLPLSVEHASHRPPAALPAVACGGAKRPRWRGVAPRTRAHRRSAPPHRRVTTQPVSPARPPRRTALTATTPAPFPLAVAMATPVLGVPAMSSLAPRCLPSSHFTQARRIPAVALVVRPRTIALSAALAQTAPPSPPPSGAASPRRCMLPLAHGSRAPLGLLGEGLLSPPRALPPLTSSAFPQEGEQDPPTAGRKETNSPSSPGRRLDEEHAEGDVTRGRWGSRRS